MDKYRIRLKEKNGLILDIGVAYTKIGFTGDNGPIKILHTPRDIFREFKDDIPKTNDSDPFMADSLNKQGLDMKIQTFLHEVFFFELIQKLSGKIIYICENYLIPRKFYETLTSVLLIQFEISKVQFLLNNSLPLYLTGQLSGLVVECGYYNTQVTPIYDGYPLFNKLVSSKASGYNMNKYLKNRIIDDNNSSKDSSVVISDSTILQSSSGNVSANSESILNNPQSSEVPIDFVALEDIKFKYCKILLKNQQEEYTKTDESTQKLKQSVISVPVNIAGSLKPSKIKLSYSTISSSCSDGLFGDIMNNDQPNIAFSILSCLGQCAPEVAVKISQNIVLSGGAASTRGFLPRLRQELIYQLDNNPEVKSAAYLKEHLGFFDHNYPPSTLVWVGASIVSQLALPEDNSITLEQFKSLKFQLPDTFGNQYLFLNNTNSTETDSNLESEEIL